MVGVLLAEDKDMPLLSHLRSWLRRSKPGRPKHQSSNRFRLTFEELERRELPATLAAPLHFDFGKSSSPVAPGYIGVPLVAYTQVQGYGWQSLNRMLAADRGTTDPLTRDLHLGRDSRFFVDLPNGTYQVTLTLGDARYARDNINVWSQAQLVVASLKTAAGQFAQPTFSAVVSQGRLDVRIADLGGINPHFSIAAMDITSVTSPFAANAGPDVAGAEGSAVTLAGSVSGGLAPFTYS